MIIAIELDEYHEHMEQAEYHIREAKYHIREAIRLRDEAFEKVGVLIDLPFEFEIEEEQ